MEDISVLLKKRQYSPGYIPPDECILFKIENKHIGSLQNFTILRFDQIFQNILRVIRHILMLFQLY
jgi:hypothetical protein